MSKFLESLELKLQSLLEGTIGRLLSPGSSTSLTTQLVALIQERLGDESNENGFMPDIITIAVSPEHLEAWQEVQPTLDEVADEIEKDWLAEGFRSKNPLKIALVSSNKLEIGEVDIQAGFTDSALDIGTSPTSLQIITRNPEPEALPQQAYFIINGKEQINLAQPVINIGRRSTSDVLIEDPLVSRDHLQLRAEGGRYLLFDLSSTGGTYINNIRVKTATLKPGDVIRIGRTILIFNQDLAQPSTSTNILTNPSGDAT